MQPSRARVVVLVSHLKRPDQVSRLAQLVSEVRDFADEADIVVYDTAIDESLALARELEERDEVDVFVCSGATSAYLRAHVTRPVLSIRIGGTDLLHALHQAQKLSPRTAIISYNHVNADLEAMKDLVAAQFHQESYSTLDGARKAVQRAAKAGCLSVIGSSTVVELAEKSGLHGVLSLTASSVRRALEEALGVLHSQRIEIAKRQHLSGVLQHIPDGVAAIDNEGIVRTINPALAAMLNIEPASALGRPLETICPELDLELALQTGFGEENRILRLGNATVVSNLLPILESGQRTGLVLTCQDTSSVERADRRIRTSRPPGTFSAKYRLEQILGDSSATAELKNLANRYAKTDSTILVTGESGTGKELLAQGIHNASKRSRGPFVAINCAALPESLLESELFGYEEGAFSGTRKGGKPGLFEVAHGGTLFLDEIGDMPLPLQTRMLRVLQEREVLRLGGTEPISIDVRIIAATHQDLRAAIQEKLFRSDLFYRINILRLQTTPLRDRLHDLRPLCLSIIRRLSGDSDSAHHDHLVDVLLPFFSVYQWPGNIRELENIVERVLISKGDVVFANVIAPERLALLVPELFENNDDLPASLQPSTSQLRSATKATELSLIEQTIRECAGNLNAAAKKLGISRSTLWRRMNGQ